MIGKIRKCLLKMSVNAHTCVCMRLHMCVHVHVCAGMCVFGCRYTIAHSALFWSF